MRKTEKEILELVAEYSCPYCGNRIKDHTNYNPYYNNPSDKDGQVCEKARSFIIIEVLIVLLSTAWSERDDLKEALKNLLKSFVKFADGGIYVELSEGFTQYNIDKANEVLEKLGK